MNLAAKAKQHIRSETQVPTMSWPLRRRSFSGKGERREISLIYPSLEDTEIPGTCPNHSSQLGSPSRDCPGTTWVRSGQAIHHPRASELRACKVRRLGPKRQHREEPYKSDTPLGTQAPNYNWKIFVLHKLNLGKREKILTWQHIIPLSFRQTTHGHFGFLHGTVRKQTSTSQQPDTWLPELCYLFVYQDHFLWELQPFLSFSFFSTPAPHPQHP